MFSTLPETASPFMNWSWEQILPYYEELAERPLNEENVEQWLRDWSHLSNLIYERYMRRHVARTIDTTDEEAEKQYNRFIENIYPAAQTAEQQLRLKLLESGLKPEGMEVPLRKIEADVDLYREENLPLRTAEQKKGAEYDKIIGAQTVTWEGEERTLTQLQPFYYTPDRETRRRIWQRKAARQLEDRQALNDLWAELLALRQEQAENAGFDNYRAYRWQELKRFAYTPQDSQRFQAAIEAVAVPAAERVYERARRQLAVERLHPWDVQSDVFLLDFPRLNPFEEVSELDATAAQIFHRVDPQLGDYFDVMRREGLLDLPNRKGKAPGGYCAFFPVANRPFIFMNAVGTARDVNTMLHEAGHAFHGFETGTLPYAPQRRADMEFNEVASMAMELLAAPYLAANEGGYYSEVEAAQHRIAHLQKIILFWPYMAVVDAFQHWAYLNPEQAADAANCDAKWTELWQRFIPAIDWSGWEDELATGWHRKQHIFRAPFYYVEYGMAQLGAIQVWRNALHDQAEAVARYREALALGGTAELPELYDAAGAQFAFDEPTLHEAITLLEDTIDSLEEALTTA